MYSNWNFGRVKIFFWPLIMAQMKMQRYKPLLTRMDSWFLPWHNSGCSNHHKPRVPYKMQWRYFPKNMSCLRIHFPNAACCLHNKEKIHFCNGHIQENIKSTTASSGTLRRVAPVRTDVSNELTAFFIRVTRIGELGKTLAETSNRRTLRRLLVRLLLFPVHRLLSPWWRRR
jgi:hypothetical protein